MKLETAIQVWTIEAKAHGYAGFLVVDYPIRGIDRVFILNAIDFALVKEKCKAKIVQEVWI